MKARVAGADDHEKKLTAQTHAEKEVNKNVLKWEKRAQKIEERKEKNKEEERRLVFKNWETV